MSILHNKTVLDKRKNNALKSHSSNFFKSFSNVLLAGFVVAVVAVFAFLAFPDKEERITKAKLELAVEKAKEKGVLIKNIEYNQADNGAKINAETAVQKTTGLSLKKVSINVKDGGVLKAKVADIDNDSGVISAKNGAVYKEKSGLSVIVNNITLDSKKNVLSGHGGVNTTSDRVQIQGQNVNYNINDKVLKIENKVIVEIDEE